VDLNHMRRRSEPMPRHAEGRGFESRRGGHIHSSRVPSKRPHSVRCRTVVGSNQADTTKDKRQIQRPQQSAAAITNSYTD